jgi:RND family efflux transporter MFP subunit
MVKFTPLRILVAIFNLVCIFYIYKFITSSNELGMSSKHEVKPKLSTLTLAMTKFVEDSTTSALTVSTVKPKLTNLSFSIPANGNVVAWQEAIIGAEVNGLMLKEIFVNSGDSVKRGQLIAHFSDATIDADIEQAKANVAEAKTAALEAEENAERAISIEGLGGLSAQQISQYKSAKSVSAAKLRAAEAQLKTQQLRKLQTFVVSPDSGVISSRTATIGMVAAPGQELFRLIRQNRVEWRAELTATEVSKIKPNMQANITLPDGSEIIGKVRNVSPNIDQQTRNAIVYVDLPQSTAKPGMYAKGEFIITNSPAYTLPASAISMQEGFAYVMQVDVKQRVKPIKVKLGRRVRDDVEVIDFKDIEADYVLSGGAFLKEGDLVKVVAQDANAD